MGEHQRRNFFMALLECLVLIFFRMHVTFCLEKPKHVWAYLLPIQGLWCWFCSAPREHVQLKCGTQESGLHYFRVIVRLVAIISVWVNSYDIVTMSRSTHYLSQLISPGFKQSLGCFWCFISTRNTQKNSDYFWVFCLKWIYPCIIIYIPLGYIGIFF